VEINARGGLWLTTIMFRNFNHKGHKGHKGGLYFNHKCVLKFNQKEHKGETLRTQGIEKDTKGCYSFFVILSERRDGSVAATRKICYSCWVL
jgi:hypothetical protein